MDSSGTPPRPGADMVGKALQLLPLLAATPQGMTLAELTRAAGHPTSTTFRLLGTLVREGFAHLDEATKRYSLGLKIYELGQRVAQAHGFGGVALPILEQLAADTREAALLSVLDGHEQLYVHYCSGPQQVRVTGEPGRRGPLHCTSAGKCLVAFAPDAVREELLDTLELFPAGPNGITDRDAFREEVAGVREAGYAIADEEHEAGIRAVGVPVPDQAGLEPAALAVAAPAYRMPVDTLLALLPRLKEAAHELALRLPRR